MCQNIQTTVGGGEVRAKSEHPNFLCPYLPNGGGGGQQMFGQCPKFGIFFLMAPLKDIIFHAKPTNASLAPDFYQNWRQWIQNFTPIGDNGSIGWQSIRLQR